MRLGFFTAFGFSAPHRAAAFILLACFSQSVFAQVSDGKGLTSLEGVVPITDDRALWDAVKDSRDVAELQAYLAQFPKGLFATLAAIRIRALGGAGAATSQQATPQAPPIAQRQNIAPGQIIKDCADCPEMVVIPAGSFEMGSNESANEQPVHLVNVPGFLLGKTEVTQGQWKALMGNNPSRFSQCGDDCPVEQVSWNEAQEFALRLSRKTGKKYRLPSEAEWEYAARAGSSGTWSFGDDETQVGDHAWHNGNSQGKAQRVAQKRPNGFGLFDMHGNVWEWVEDCFQSNYSGAPTDGSAWTTAGSVCFRVLRGGSWFNLPSGLRSAVRNRYSPVILNVDYGGLRLARSAVATPQSTLGSSPLPAAGATAPQASSPTDSYSARLVAHIRPNITFRPDLAGIVGNPGAEVEVRAYADGTIISRKLLKSSGVKAWDEAVLKAIDKTDTLPRDIDGRVPSDFVFTFRPKDQQDLVAERLAQKLESERIAVYAQQKLAHGREAAAPAEETCPFPPVNTGSDTPTPAKWTSPAVIYFDQDSFAIKPESESVVKTHARLLLVETARRVVLEGHTEISVGREYGLAIGQKRAEAVRRALTCLGVPENQVDAVSLGTEKTAVQGTDDASHAKNRRVEIRYR